MAKKLTKHGNSLALIIDKPILNVLGINEKTNLEILVMGDTSLLNPRVATLKIKRKDNLSLKMLLII